MIEETAAWYLYMFHCQDMDPVDNQIQTTLDNYSIPSEWTTDPPQSNLHIQGYSEWKNTIGYLDGIDYHFIKVPT